ncbi:hypothetical protein [uncultured Proteiniphilum sp.]|uniref:hypothetical protein n=1 Tax=uncultured Proteiniphilum sp. TaxID=497637 RepID=UPI00262893DC|nr:hypothetical protein [uncultured Proteiniphilum sp.]
MIFSLITSTFHEKKTGFCSFSFNGTIRCLLMVFLTIVLMGASCDEKNTFLTETITDNEKTPLEEFQLIHPLAGTDELGRILPDNAEAGDVREDRQVAMFYFLWQGDISSKTSEIHWDLNKMLPQYSGILKDRDHPNWGSTSLGSYYFWGEPVYGYYRGDDYWVHLKNMQLLTDAGVDFLVLDATNTIIYEKQSEALMKAIKSLQDQGKNPPTIVYYTNTASGKTMQRVYNAFYKEGASCYYPSTWYYLEGKPLLLGRTKEARGTEYESFFTFREAQWPNEPEQQNGWPWIDFNRPQSVYENSKGEREIINVSVAQHPNPAAGMGGSAFYGNMDNWGRSYRNGSHGNPETDIRYGYNFQEQWDYALAQDVPFIFVTGWNEWIAGRWGSHDGNPEHSYFVDQADPEYSRDIEPTYTAGLKDNYYMQLVANIRRYKGVASQPLASPAKTIRTIADWEEVKPVYPDYINDVMHRAHPGAETNPAKTYLNTTGRNDFYRMKVTRDAENLYFYAETTGTITENEGNNWMRLFLNTDRKHDTGWYGYDYRIEGGKQLQKYIENQWSTIGIISAGVEGNQLMYSIPLSAMQIDTRGLDIEFKWSDNMQDDGDPMDWYLNGDTAPGGRFNFVYSTK